MQDIGPQSDLPDQVEPRLAIARLEQTRQSLKKVAAAKVIEAAPLLCGLDQIHGKHSGAWNSCFFQ